MQKQQTRSHGKALPMTLRRRLEALVDQKGEVEALKLLGLSKQTLYRAMAGLPIHRGTVLQVETFAAAEAK